MPALLSTTGYRTVYVLDSQLALEAKPLAEWDWGAIQIESPALLLVLPQMMSEVDSKKRDGRLGERARAFNRLIEPCTVSPNPIRVSETPLVDLALCASSRIDWAVLDDLDPGQGDDRLVAEALNALVDDASRLCMLSYDTRPRAAAIRHGLSAAKPPETWMLAPEPSPAEKETMRLKQRIAELSASRPEFIVSLRDADTLPAKVLRVEAIDPQTRPYVTRFWLEKNPPIGGGMMDFDFGYDDRYDAFETAMERYPEALPLALQTMHGQRRLLLTVENTGHVAGEHVEVEVRTSNGSMFERLQLKRVLPPKAPEREAGVSSLRHTFPSMPTSFVGSRIDVVFDGDTDGTNAIRYSCEDFRQRRVWEGEFFLALDPDGPAPATIDVVVTARNLSGRVETGLVLPFEVEDKVVEDLIDLSTMELKVGPPHAAWLQAVPKDAWDERVDLGE